MYSAICERTEDFIGFFETEEELLKEIDSISVVGEMWDIYTPSSGNAIAYYHTVRN